MQENTHVKGDHLYVGQVGEHFERGVKSCDVVVGCIQYTQFPAAHHRQKVSLQHGGGGGGGINNTTTPLPTQRSRNSGENIGLSIGHRRLDAAMGTYGYT